MPIAIEFFQHSTRCTPPHRFRFSYMGMHRESVLWRANGPRARDVACTPQPADWKRYGRGAGPARNQAMLVEFNPQLLVAFPGGKGTADMVRRAQKAGVRVEEA